MAGLYGSARSSLNHVEVGSRLECKLSDEETERRQGIMSPMRFELCRCIRRVLSFGRRACWVEKWREI